MTASGEEFWLIVQPAAKADERLTTVVPELARLGLDPFTARQRLVGHGPALLARGERTLLEKGADLLRAHRFIHWLLIPTPPRWAPERILSLRPSPEAIHFTCRHGEVVFPRDSPVLAVLADLSGKMPERQMQRLVAQNAYRGVVSPATEEELYLEVVRGEPVLDLYLLSPAGGPQHGVRIFPGRFDPQGLGELATYSATGNLEALLALVRGQAGSFCLHCEFGLASLPGCRPQPAEGGDQRRQSLAALTRFGWLLTDLRQAEARAETAGGQRARTGTAAAAALLYPLTTGLGTTPVPPPLATVAAGNGSAWPVAAATTDSAGEPAAASPIGLPPPPLAVEGDGDGGGFRPLAWFTGGLGLALGMLATGDGEVSRLLWHGGVRSGLFPVLLSTGLFLAGVQALRWKRWIETTPTSRVRSMAMGMVEVHGRAERQHALVSPMTHLGCVWYRLRRYRRHRQGWRLTSSRSSGAVPFFLDDGTGRVQIDPRRAVIRPRHRQEGYGQGGILLSAGVGSQDEKWVEEVIAEGTYLYVLGFARGRRPLAPSLAERTRERLRRLKSDPIALRQFDSDGDGRISTEEWEAARIGMEQAALGDQLSEAHTPRRQEERVVIGRPGGRLLPFIIAETASEAHLAGRYGIAAAVLLAAGLLTAALAASLILNRYLF